VNPYHGRRINIDDKPLSGATSSASTASAEKNGLSASSFSGYTATPLTASSSAYPDLDTENPYNGVNLPRDRRTELHTPQSTQSLNHPRTQKEEMLAGRHYFPFDKELVLERERCSAACWRFNNCNDPNNSVSPEEQLRLFRDILHPRDLVVSASEASPFATVGRVGDNVIVKAPFSCDYGYNITIGQDVAIGKYCLILDTCSVVIGDRCNIGPNVNIYTATPPNRPREAPGLSWPQPGTEDHHRVGLLDWW
jgi:acetyltransferase-like isoleucine patch superfamily enzyme